MLRLSSRVSIFLSQLLAHTLEQSIIAHLRQICNRHRGRIALAARCARNHQVHVELARRVDHCCLFSVAIDGIEERQLLIIRFGGRLLCPEQFERILGEHPLLARDHLALGIDLGDACGEHLRLGFADCIAQRMQLSIRIADTNLVEVY